MSKYTKVKIIDTKIEESIIVNKLKDICKDSELGIGTLLISKDGIKYTISTISNWDNNDLLLLKSVEKELFIEIRIYKEILEEQIKLGYYSIIYPTDHAIIEDRYLAKINGDLYIINTNSSQISWESKEFNLFGIKNKTSIRKSVDEFFKETEELVDKKLAEYVKEYQGKIYYANIITNTFCTYILYLDECDIENNKFAIANPEYDHPLTELLKCDNFVIYKDDDIKEGTIILDKTMDESVSLILERNGVFVYVRNYNLLTGSSRKLKIPLYNLFNPDSKYTVESDIIHWNDMEDLMDEIKYFNINKTNRESITNVLKERIPLKVLCRAAGNFQPIDNSSLYIPDYEGNNEIYNKVSSIIYGSIWSNINEKLENKKISKVTNYIFLTDIYDREITIENVVETLSIINHILKYIEPAMNISYSSHQFTLIFDMKKIREIILKEKK